MTVRSFEQLEGNLSLSFGYVKKDIMAVNESVAELHTQIKHLSMNQAALMGKIDQLNRNLSKKPAKVASKKSLSFYDVKTKKKFTTSNYTLKTIKGRKFAIAKSPQGNRSYRIIGAVKSSKVAKKKVAKKAKKTKTVKTKKVEKKTDATPKKVITETVLYE